MKNANSSKLIKKLLFAPVYISMAMLSTVLFAQEPQPAQPEKQTGEVTKISFVPEAQQDPRFHVTEPTFDIRMDSQGRGEILDVVFEIQNNTKERVDLYGYVIAFRETDAVDNAARGWIPYPSWRKHDPSRSTYLVRGIKITPVQLDPDSIWSENDPEYTKVHRTINRLKTSVGSAVPIMDVLPPMSFYLNAISKIPAQGVKFSVYGTMGPEKGKALVTDYLPPDQAKNKENYDISINHTHTVEHFQRKTIFRSHHMAFYTPNFKMYNMVSVILFEAQKADTNQNISDSDKEKAEDSIVFYRTFKIKRNLKML